MHLKTGARQHKDVRGSVSSCSLPLCGRSTKTFPHSWMTCLQIDSLSHWTLHDIVFHSARISAQRQLMFHEAFIMKVDTVQSITQWHWRTPTSNGYKEPLRPDLRNSRTRCCKLPFRGSRRNLPQSGSEEEAQPRDPVVRDLEKEPQPTSQW